MVERGTRNHENLGSNPIHSEFESLTSILALDKRPHMRWSIGTDLLVVLHAKL